MTDLFPHNIEAEQALLGAILEDGTAFPLVRIEAADFYIHRHQYIWRAFHSLQQRGQAIDLVTVADELDKHGHLNEVGGVHDPDFSKGGSSDSSCRIRSGTSSTAVRNSSSWLQERHLRRIL